VNPKMRQMLGLVTVALFGFVGVSLLMEDRVVAGTVVIMLACFRLALWARQQFSLGED
jgi:hypothetical protein